MVFVEAIMKVVRNTIEAEDNYRLLMRRKDGIELCFNLIADLPKDYMK